MPLETDKVRILFLDVDGVLNRTGFRPGQSLGLRSWIEPDLARRLTDVLKVTGANVVMSSDWRQGRSLQELQAELAAAGVECTLIGMTPVLGQARWREIEAWIVEHDVAAASIVIVDDGYDMGPFASRFVRASPLNGLDDDSARDIARLFGVSASET
jgi:hypothetical protein